MMEPTPYQRIMLAARRRRGVRLSAEDVQALARDDAIAQVAWADDERQRSKPLAARSPTGRAGATGAKTGESE